MATTTKMAIVQKDPTDDITAPILRAIIHDGKRKDSNKNHFSIIIEFLVKMRYEGYHNISANVIFETMAAYYKISLSEIVTTLQDSNKLLSLNNDSRNYLSRLLDELVILLYYLPDLSNKLAPILCDYLLLTTKTSINRNAVQHNYQFYIDKLSGDGLKFHRIDIELPKLPTVDDKFRPINPSILVNDDGTYTVLVRGVNFAQDHGTNYHSLDNDGLVRTCNMMTTMDSDFKILNQKEIVDTSTWTKHPHTVTGLEDCRLFSKNHPRKTTDDIWFTCTSLESSDRGRPQVVVNKLAEDYTLAVSTVIQGPDPNRAEKNWLPFFAKDDINIVYGYQPVQVIKPNLDDGSYEVLIAKESGYNFDLMRGSAGPHPFVINDQPGYLAVIHEVLFQGDENRRTYYHRFIWFNENFELKYMSRLFYFLEAGIEFCSGLSQMLGEDGNILLGFGLDDREAYILEIPVYEVRSLLFPIPDL